jgi:hypothetical protein
MAMTGRDDRELVALATADPKFDAGMLQLDFRQGVYKFRSTPYGSLPTTSDLHRVLQEGLYSTYMPPWRLA